MASSTFQDTLSDTQFFSRKIGNELQVMKILAKQGVAAPHNLWEAKQALQELQAAMVLVEEQFSRLWPDEVARVREESLAEKIEKNGNE